MNQPYHLYIAACDPEGGVYHYTLTPEGALRFCDRTPMDRPMYLAEENGQLYVLLRGLPEFGEDRMHSAVVSLPLDANGTPGNPTAPVYTQGRCGCHLEVRNGAVYVANYLSGNVTLLPDRCVAHAGHGPNPRRQEGPHTHFVKRTPDDKYLFAVDLGLDTIFTYDYALNEVARAKVPAGAGCRHLSYSEDGRTVFCGNELDSTVSVFSYEDGHLTLKNTYSALPAGYTGESYIAALRTRGDLLYVSNRGHDSIARFRIDGDRLTLLECTPCGGEYPRDFNIFGDWLVCTNEHSNNVTFFRLEEGKPVIQPIELPLPQPLCVIARG